MAKSGKSAKQAFGFGIFLSVIILINLALLVVCGIRPANFGEFLINVYEDITNTYGHTVDAMYTKATVIIAGISIALAVIVGIIALVYVKKLEKGEHANKAKIEVLKEVVVKKEKNHEEKKVKKEKREKASKEKKEVIEPQAEEKSVETKTTNVNSIDDFLNSMRG